MRVTRREFGKVSLASLLGLVATSEVTRGQATAKPNRSVINGVQFGLQPFCYHDLAMNMENRR